MVLDPFAPIAYFTPNTMSLTSQLLMRKLANWDIANQTWEMLLPLPRSITMELQPGDHFHPVCTEMEKTLKQNGYACIIFKKDGKDITLSVFIESKNLSAV